MTKKLVTLPNIRKLFVPAPGFVMFDCDLAGADAQVVAWEAEDEELKAAFRAGLDVHSKNAEDMWGPAFTRLAGTKDDGPKSRKRKECKQAVHLTNYGGTARTASSVLGWTVHEADQFQRRWFSLHPGIKTNFHGKIESALRNTRTVYNRFGYRRVYFDRIDTCFPEALAWKPQSTVAEVSFRGALQLEEEFGLQTNFYNQAVWAEHEMARWTEGMLGHFGNCEMLIQVHDSLVFQLRPENVDIARIRKGLTVPIPYDDPLTIQWGMTSSAKSWGEATKVTEAA